MIGRLFDLHILTCDPFPCLGTIVQPFLVRYLTICFYVIGMCTIPPDNHMLTRAARINNKNIHN